MEHTQVFITQEITISDKTKSPTVDRFQSLNNIITEIKSDKHLRVIEKLKDSDKEKRTEIKQNELPIFYPCVYLPEYKALGSNSTYHSTGIIQFDVDDLTYDKAINLKEQLINIPELLYAFISPSGGVKFGIASDFNTHDTNILKEEFTHAYAIAKQFIVSQIDNIILDDSVSSINQGCYFSYDRDAYLNESPTILKVADQAKINRIEQETLDNTHRINIIQDFDDINKDEALKALQCIPTNFSYTDRLPINLSVISIFESDAENTLVNHWVTEDKTKLRNDIRSQIKSFKANKITAGSLFYIAKEYGYSTTLRNQKSISTTLPATFSPTIYSLADAKRKLEELIRLYFLNGGNYLIHYEAGAGKTESVIEAIVSILINNPSIKIALFVPTHTLAEEIKGRISQIVKEKISQSQSFKAQMKTSNSVFVQHIKGRELSNCNHPIKKRIESTRNQAEKNVLNSVFKQNPSKFCLSCPWNNSCQYIEQFDTLSVNVRIYTHNTLFQSASFWDSGSIDTDGKLAARSNQWIPDFLIVDEDIISNGVLSDSLIERTAYNNASDLLQNIIHELKENSLEIVTEKYSNELIEASNLQQEEQRAWNKTKHTNTTDNLNKMVIDYNKSQSNKPMYYQVLDALAEYSIALKNKKNSVELRNYAIFLGNNNTTLYYAQRQNIHNRFKNIPTLLLDASANKDIVEAAFSKSFKFESIRVEYQSNVKVTQFENKVFSKKQLNSDPHSLNNAKEFIKRKANDKSFGLITYKSLENHDNFAENLSNELGADNWGYFGSIRGIDSFSDCDSLFVLGRQLIPPHILEVKFRQLYGGICETDYIPDFIQIPTQKVFRMEGGKHREIKSMDYDDKRMVALNNHFNRAESYQAANRLRLIHGDKIKNLYILSNDVLDMTVTELINSDDEFGRIHNKTLTKYQVLADGIQNKKIVRNMPAALSFASGLSKADISNLKKKKDDFIKQIIQCNNEIDLLEYKGSDTNYKKTTKQFLIINGYKPTAKELGFNEIISHSILPIHS